MRIPIPASWAVSTSRRSASSLGMSALTAALDAQCHVDGDRWAEWTASARADYEDWSALPEAGDRLDLGAAIAALRERLPEDTVYCNGAGQLHGVGPPLHPLPPMGHPAGSAERRDGIRGPCGARGPAGTSRPARGGLRRRRLLSDVRPGAGHHGRGGPTGDRRRCQQRHAGHHPDASGAPLPPPGDRHRSRQPPLRRAGARLRRPRGTGGALRGCARRGGAGARQRPPRPHRAHLRSRRADARARRCRHSPPAST